MRSSRTPGRMSRSPARSLPRSRRGHSVWYDEAELCVGDSLTEEIDRGLTTSRFGVVILSRAFFAKRLTRRELQAFIARETAGGVRAVLPVWHEIDEHYLVETAPLLADVLAANTNEGIDSIAAQISRAIRRRPPGPIAPADAQAPTHGQRLSHTRGIASRAARQARRRSRWLVLPPCPTVRGQVVSNPPSARRRLEPYASRDLRNARSLSVSTSPPRRSRTTSTRFQPSRARALPPGLAQAGEDRGTALLTAFSVRHSWGREHS